MQLRWELEETPHGVPDAYLRIDAIDDNVSVPLEQPRKNLFRVVISGNDVEKLLLENQFAPMLKQRLDLGRAQFAAFDKQWIKRRRRIDLFLPRPRIHTMIGIVAAITGEFGIAGEMAVRRSDYANSHVARKIRHRREFRDDPIRPRDA